MPPLDPDDLAELAFDPATPELDADDRASLDAYRRVIDAARSTEPSERNDEDAPPEVWAAISGELFSGASAPEMARPLDAPLDDIPPALLDGSVQDFRRPDHGNRGPNADDVADDADAVVTPIVRPQRWRSPTTLGTIAAAIVVLAGALVFAVNRNDSPPTETATVVAQAELGVLPPGDPAGAPGTGTGTAALERTGDRLDIVLQTTDVTTPPPGEHYEVWLLNRTGPVQPQSIGVMESPNGKMRAPVPSTVDTAKFDVVDISLELNDGNHDHSGHSLLRGTLQ